MENFKLSKRSDPNPFTNNIFSQWRSYLGLAIVIIAFLISAGILLWVYFGGSIEDVGIFFAGMEKDTDIEINNNDLDQDGLTNSEEAFYGTDPARADTDNDGYSDYDEVQSGYNPLGEGRLLNKNK